MHYKIGKLTIETERAAKPVSQRSVYLASWLNSLPKLQNAADFGCGRLRYSYILYRKTRSLTLTDSDEQLQKEQILQGRKTNIAAHCQRQMPNARVLTLDQFRRHSNKYSFILCSNVLSVIPSRDTQKLAINDVREHLKRDGTALFVTQYRNSDFDKMRSRPNAKSYHDGWVLDSPRGAFYYGIIAPEKLEQLVTSDGLKVRSQWTNEGSAFILVERKR